MHTTLAIGTRCGLAGVVQDADLGSPAVSCHRPARRHPRSPCSRHIASRLVLPSVMDAQVHVRRPGQTQEAMPMLPGRAVGRDRPRLGVARIAAMEFADLRSRGDPAGLSGSNRPCQATGTRGTPCTITGNAGEDLRGSEAFRLAGVVQSTTGRCRGCLPGSPPGGEERHVDSEAQRAYARRHVHRDGQGHEGRVHAPA